MVVDMVEVGGCRRTKEGESSCRSRGKGKGEGNEKRTLPFGHYTSEIREARFDNMKSDESVNIPIN